jgi:hypothetical protein
LSADEFLDRVFARMADFTRKPGFTSEAWTYNNRPTKEGLGRLPIEIDVEAMVSRILDVEEYPRNVRYVESVEILRRRSPSDFTYVQKMSLPVLGGLQCALNLTDTGEREGFRVVAWSQDDDATQALDKKTGGARTTYNLGAWILKPTEVWYALSSAPRKDDVGSLKFAIMTKGGEVTAGEVLRGNIAGMVAWSQKD